MTKFTGASFLCVADRKRRGEGKGFILIEVNFIESHPGDKTIMYMFYMCVYVCMCVCVYNTSASRHISQILFNVNYGIQIQEEEEKYLKLDITLLQNANFF